MANDIDRTSPHYKGDFGSIYEVNKKFPTGGVAGDFVVIEGWAHYWNADRATWCVNAQRDSYWDELITNIIEKFKLVKGATYMGVASLDTVPAKVIGAKMYYFATVAGTYKNFGDLVVPQGINVLYSENGSSWVNSTLLEVAQELGASTQKVVSQKVLNDVLLKKFNKENIVQESGEAEDKVMSQKAVSDKLCDLSSKKLSFIHHRLTNTYDEDGAYPMRNLPVLKAGKTYRIYAVAPNEDLVAFNDDSGLFFVYTDKSAEPNITHKTIAEFNAGFEVEFTPQKDGYLEYRVGKVNINKELEFKVWTDDEGVNELCDATNEKIEHTYATPLQTSVFSVADNNDVQITNIRMMGGVSYRIFCKAEDFVSTWSLSMALYVTTDKAQQGVSSKQIHISSYVDFNAGFSKIYTPQNDCRLMLLCGAANAGKKVTIKLYTDKVSLQEKLDDVRAHITPFIHHRLTNTYDEDGAYPMRNLPVLKAGKTYRIYAVAPNEDLVAFNDDSGLFFVYTDKSAEPNITHKTIAEFNAGFEVEFTPQKDGYLEYRVGKVNINKELEFKVWTDDEGVNELVGADTPNIKFNLWKGKKAITLGDSHTGNRNYWMPIICDKLEMQNLTSLNNSVVSGDANILQSAYELCICPLLSQAYSLMDKAKDGEVDVIFIEEVHYGEGRISNFDTIENSYPLKPTQLLSLGTFNMTVDEEKANFENNYQSLLSSVDSSSRKKRTTLKSSIKTVSRTITFGGINETLHAGNFVLTIDGHDFSTQISEGMYLIDAVSAIFSWSFREYTNWKNVSKTGNTITIVYEGSSSDVPISFSHTDNGTGISCSISEPSSASTDVYRYFASENVDEWLDKSKWVYYAGPWDNPYASFKGVIEILQENFPNAILVPFTMFDNAFNEGNYNPRFDMVDYRTNRFPKMYKRVKVLLDVAEYYFIKGIDVLKLCGISPFNFTAFYNYNNVHPKAEGYKRIAETLVKELL